MLKFFCSNIFGSKPATLEKNNLKDFRKTKN